MDKTVAYGIQGKGGYFVRTITGSYHAVMGLPLVETHELLSNFVALGDVRPIDWRDYQSALRKRHDN